MKPFCIPVLVLKMKVYLFNCMKSASQNKDCWALAFLIYNNNNNNVNNIKGKVVIPEQTQRVY